MDKTREKAFIFDLYNKGCTYREIAKLTNIEFTSDWYDCERVRDLVRRIKKQQLKLKNQDIKCETNNSKEQSTKIDNKSNNKIDMIKIRDEIAYNNQILRETARIEAFYDKICDSIKSLKPLKIPKFIDSQDEMYMFNSGVLMMADQHYGVDFQIKGLEEGEVINHYSPEIFEKRMWDLLNKTVILCNQNSFNELVIMDLGDSLDGILRISQLMSLRYGIIDSCIYYSEFMANWLNRLSEYVKINYYSTEGNHTMLRLLTGKKGDFPNENMQKIIDKIISIRLEGNPNVKVHKNYTDKIFVNVRGANILGIHGEEKDAVQALKDYSQIYKKDINYLVHGHKHHPCSADCGVMKGVIGVGSIMGTNDFAFKIKRTAEPSATFSIFSENLGKVSENIIRLSN